MVSFVSLSRTSLQFQVYKFDSVVCAQTVNKYACFWLLLAAGTANTRYDMIIRCVQSIRRRCLSRKTFPCERILCFVCLIPSHSFHFPYSDFIFQCTTRFFHAFGNAPKLFARLSLSLSLWCCLLSFWSREKTHLSPNDNLVFRSMSKRNQYFCRVAIHFGMSQMP